MTDQIKHHGNTNQHESRPKKRKIKHAHIWQAISAILLIAVVVLVVSNGKNAEKAMTKEEAAEKAIEYINTNLLQQGQEATVNEVAEESGLYKLGLEINGQKFDSYMTKDGQMLFPSAVNMEEPVKRPETQNPAPAQPAATNAPKTDKPKVELFVMSYCPYGTQMEKGFLPVATLLGDNIDWDVKFVNYAMHGEKEVTENLLQYCIQKEMDDKYLDYLGCFLEAGDSESCLDETGIDKADLQSCMDATDKEFDISANLEDQSSWLSGRYPKFMIHDAENQKYGIRGSPGFVLNGVTIGSQGRSPAAILTSVCNAFTDAPEECDKQLTGNPSPGFGFAEGSASAAVAACGA